MNIKTPIALVYNTSGSYSTSKPVHIKYSTKDEIDWSWLSSHWERKIVLNATIQSDGNGLVVSGQLAEEYEIQEEDFNIDGLDVKVEWIPQSYYSVWIVFGKDRQKAVDALREKYVISSKISEKKTFWRKTPFLEFKRCTSIVKSTEGIPDLELVHADRYLVTHLSMG